MTDHHDTAAEAARENAIAKRILLILLVAVVAWGGAIWKWGVPGLYIPALASVPVIYLLLIIVAKG